MNVPGIMCNSVINIRDSSKKTFSHIMSSIMRAKKGGGQLQTKNIIGAVQLKLCLFSLYFVKYIIYTVWKAL